MRMLLFRGSGAKSPKDFNSLLVFGTANVTVVVNHWDQWATAEDRGRRSDVRDLVRSRDAARRAVLFGIPDRACADRSARMGGAPVRLRPARRCGHARPPATACG